MSVQKNYIKADQSPDTKKRHHVASSMNRRQLLATSAAGALSALFSGAPSFVAAQSGNGDAYSLVADWAHIDSQDYKLRAYNGQTPGPTLRVKQGETLKVNVKNVMGPNAPEEVCPANHNGYHGSNITNFHTHGLHVSPNVSASGADSDNIFLQLLPDGQTYAGCNTTNLRETVNNFEFDIRSDHPPGTFWYHAHKHGSTARQVANGLLGPLIVEEPAGYYPDYISQATEQGREDILIIQLRDLPPDEPGKGDPSGTLAIVRANPNGQGGGDRVDAASGGAITMKRGEVRRLRFINAAPSVNAFVNLVPLGAEADKPEFWQIAFDGLKLDRRYKVVDTGSTDPWDNPAALAPGNRTDIMVRIPPDAQEGLFKLTNAQPRAEILHGMSMLKAAEPLTLNIKIEGSLDQPDLWSDEDDLPGKVHPDLNPEGAIKRTVAFEFVDNSLGIDGELFSGKVKEPKMKLGTVGDWTVANSTGFTHPFHIHVNPFFITHIRGEKLKEGDPRRRWQDTIALPNEEINGDKPGTIRFLTKFENFTGKFVIHCHILRHEDTGMMQAVEVVS